MNDFLCRLCSAENLVLLSIYVFVLPVVSPLILYLLIRELLPAR